MHTKQLNEIKLADLALVGGKAAYLGELINAGFDVPRGICVTAQAYRDALDAHGIQSKIIERIKKTEIEDPVELEECAEDIRAWIENVSIPTGIVQEIQSAIDSIKMGTGLFAVRVSRIIEDVVNPAASGLQQAFLAVKSDAINDCIRKCWSSPWNSRAIYFRNRKKIDQASVTMAVVIQPMIDPDASGVMFTANPLTGATDEIHIDATWGVGEAIIAARCKPDHYVVQKKSLAIRERTVASKAVMDMPSADGGLQTVSLSTDKQDAPCLSDEQIGTLAKLGEQIESQFKSTQDLEWCVSGGKIWLLQTRPLQKK